MKRLLGLLAAVALAVIPAAAQAQLDTVTRDRAANAFQVPAQLTPAQRVAYRAVFADLEAGNWAGALGRLDEMREGPLHDAVRAQLYTMRGSPRVELEPLLALLSRAPYLPQASDLARLAQARGATALPVMPQRQELVGLRGQPRRQRPRAVRTEPLAGELDALIQPLVRDDKATEAEALLVSRAAELSPEVLTEFQQRVAWMYYLNGALGDARRMAELARAGPGDWALQAEWIAGLAAWRLNDCAAAENSFVTVARRTGDPELAAAGHYWASRAALRCRHPERVQAHLRAAAGNEETFYGLLADSALADRREPAGEVPGLTARDWSGLSQRPNVRAAIALLEAGQPSLADQALRHQARIGPSHEHVALVRLAAALNLTQTQIYLAHNAPRGLQMSRHDRYPAPDWRPANAQWRVDQALAYAHALQESVFAPNAVSSVGARGLMQIRPGTAGDLVRWGRASADPARLSDPQHNLAFGQGYMEYLRDQPGTDALLPRVIAAYNAGPVPIARWTAEGVGGGDPLLYIESLPYWETRGYVPIILRNFWMYEHQPADRSVTRRALAGGQWPRFPGAPGPVAVRLTPTLSGGGD